MARYPSRTGSMYDMATSSSSVGTSGTPIRHEHGFPLTPPYVTSPPSASYHTSSGPYAPYVGAGGGGGSGGGSGSNTWPIHGQYSSLDAADDVAYMSEPGRDSYAGTSPPSGLGRHGGKARSQRKSSNRDEFDGPQVQYLARPSMGYISMQEREMPQLPTNLRVSEQDALLAAVNDRLSQCAFDFVAKYQFPIPLTQDMRPVERPQDREWTEWVYLLKRLATKRRIPARVLYNGQIKQFVTILENSLEMRHAAKHQSRPLKDDRNILQLISAGIQVAKILKDAPAMDYLDRLYVTTEQQIHERAAAAAAAMADRTGSRSR
ncbi:hypothetical protein GGS20DRAFT_579452 [Poronia punctata]|nr:hypothetical protein GGS20DRAFT_579452 [Poronia punctata]